MLHHVTPPRTSCFFVWQSDERDKVPRARQLCPQTSWENPKVDWLALCAWENRLASSGEKWRPALKSLRWPQGNSKVASTSDDVKKPLDTSHASSSHHRFTWFSRCAGWEPLNADSRRGSHGTLEPKSKASHVRWEVKTLHQRHEGTLRRRDALKKMKYRTQPQQCSRRAVRWTSWRFIQIFTCVTPVGTRWNKTTKQTNTQTKSYLR